MECDNYFVTDRFVTVTRMTVRMHTGRCATIVSSFVIANASFFGFSLHVTLRHVPVTRTRTRIPIACWRRVLSSIGFPSNTRSFAYTERRACKWTSLFSIPLHLLVISMSPDRATSGLNYHP